MHKAIQKISKSLRFPAFGIVIISLTGCTALSLNRGSYQWSDFLKDTDSNGSKSVELEEFSDFLSRQGGTSENVPDSFSDMDLDDNGSIDETEFARRRSKAVTKAKVATGQPWRNFKTIADRNDDGNISKAEWDNAPRNQVNIPEREEFKIFDLNGDGKVTQAEYATASEQ